MKRHRSGFTIFELSIVLTIITLLIAGVLVGKQLIRNAHLRTVMKEVETYRTALKQFSDKYNALPGDMYNATDFWGTDLGCPAGSWDATPKTATCNGNGDGKIGARNDDTGVNANMYESFRAWQHMADAGLINGFFVGTPGPSGSGMQAEIGLNTPRAQIGQVGYMIYFLTCDACSNFFPMPYRHVIAAGGQGAGADDSTSAPFLSPDEAQNIDSKMDDGLPATGRIVAPSSQSACVTSTDPTTARYNSSSPTPLSCSLLFITGM